MGIFIDFQHQNGEIYQSRNDLKLYLSQKAVSCGTSTKVGQAFKMALTAVASGIAKKTPQKPQSPPKNKIATIIATGCKLTASENNKGTSTTPSIAGIIE